MHLGKSTHMKHSRRYWETHGGSDSPLLIIHDYLKARGSYLEPEDFKQLAEKVQLPESTVRGVVSYYSDIAETTETIHYCQGTSCALAGADDLQRLMRGRTHPKGVYCLGYCDQSPALLDSNGHPHTGHSALAFAAGIESPPASSPVSIRCLARRPIVTRRLGSNFSKLGAAIGAGCYRGLANALELSPSELISAVEASGERGRGGAGFPTGTKWRSCAEVESDQRYVIANGDEGDPGSFIDRLLMEDDPHGIIEGLLICAYAIGASQCIVFIRSEYPEAQRKMRAAISEAREAGLFRLKGKGCELEVEISVFPAMGSYVCGEETALLSAIEGLRGEVQIRPPYPTQEGLYGKPTVVNNVETLVNIAAIMDMGPEQYREMGTPGSAGTKALCFNRGFSRPGILEVEFGYPLRSAIEEAGLAANGAKLDAVILGGPMGTLLTPNEWDVPICYRAMGEKGIQLGHGGLIALTEGTNYRSLLRHWIQFMMDESCGKCVPCRLGSREAWKTLDQGNDADSTIEKLERLFELMEQGSLCAFGQFMPGPMRQMITHFRNRIFVQE